jgi:hypothetical protein
MGTQASQLLLSHLSSSFDEWVHSFAEGTTPARAEYLRSAASVFPRSGTEIPAY